MTTVTTAPSDTTAPGPVRRGLLAAGRDQAVVAGAQLLAGAGNLAFVALAARALQPAGFGHLAAFVAVLTLGNLPAAGLAAAGASSPRRARRLARRTAAAGLAAGALVALASSPLAALLGLPLPYVLALAAAAPAAALLGLHRGLAYGRKDHRAVVASLLAEPAGRLVIGLGLAAVAGAPGAAWGATAGGWLALVALHRAGDPSPWASVAHRRAAATGATGVAFVGLALLQHQDLVLANRLLDGADAGAFAALSTVGGLVAFATATLPYVLLPAAQRAEPGSGTVATGAALAVALGAVAVAVVASEPLLLAVVGTRYTDLAPLVPPYLAAMGALGVARVLAAQRCGAGAGRRAAWIVGVAAGGHAVALLALARTPGQIVAVSTVALTATAGVLALPGTWQPQLAPAWRARLSRVAAHPDAPLLAVLTVAAVAVRLATERSFWIDEAVSIRQAQLPFGAMLDELRGADVHPPLHHIVLWLTSRVLGVSEWAMRAPSMLFGAALVPVLYGAARAAFDRRTASIAAVLAVPAPFLVWYSQEARMYSLFMLVGVAGVWAQIHALRTGRPAAFAAWGLASALLVWTQWFAVLPLLVQHVAAGAHLLAQRRARRPVAGLLRGWAGSVALTACLVAPLVPYLLDQLAAYAERGAGLSMPSAAGTDSSSVVDGLSSYALIANVVWALAGYHSDAVMVRLGALWPLAMLGGLLLLGRRAGRSTQLIVAVALVPALVLYAVGHSKRDLFELRYFVLAAPLLLLVAARAVRVATSTRLATALATTALVVLTSVGLADQQLNGTNPRLYDFRGAVHQIEETARPGDVLAPAPPYLDGVLAYYAPQLDITPLARLEPAEVEGSIYVVVAERFLREGAAGAVGDELAQLEAARGEPDRFERPNVVVWRFE